MTYPYFENGLNPKKLGFVIKNTHNATGIYPVAFLIKKT